MPGPCRLFAVMLDRPSFTAEPGVLFIKVISDYPPDGDDDELWMEVERSAGMPEVTRKLKMLAVEEHQAGFVDTRKALSPEEHSAVCFAALESYRARQGRLRQGGNWQP